MAIETKARRAELLNALKADDWTEVLAAIGAAALYLQQVPTGDVLAEAFAIELSGLSGHEKWEVRRAVAQAAGHVLTPVFEPALVRLVADDNARVRQAAQQAILRRRDWRNASAFGRQHEERINATLDDIETRFGLRGREAVKRAAEQLANTFARELYHEVIKLISPLVTASDRLRAKASSATAPASAVIQEADRIERQVIHLRAVLDAMRTYASVPHLVFAPASVADVVEEAASVARSWKLTIGQPEITIDVPPSYTADLARPRVVQAFTNLLVNAIESYEGLAELRGGISVRAEQTDGIMTLTVEDFGCGMSAEVLQDAPTLFSTGKSGGTGVGLPLAIKIIEAEHGGRVTLKSTKGVGTTVTVMLPSQRPAGP